MVDALTFDDMNKHDLEELYWYLGEVMDDNHNYRSICKKWKDEINNQYKEMYSGDKCTIVFRGVDHRFMVDTAKVAFENRGEHTRSKIASKILELMGL